MLFRSTPLRARATESFLLGKPWSTETVDAAATLLANEYTPLSDMRASSAYRRVSAAGLLRRLWLEHIDTTPARLCDLEELA